MCVWGGIMKLCVSPVVTDPKVTDGEWRWLLPHCSANFRRCIARWRMRKRVAVLRRVAVKGIWVVEASRPSGPNQKASLSNYLHWCNECVRADCRFHCVGTARRQNTQRVLTMGRHRHMGAITVRSDDCMRSDRVVFAVSPEHQRTTQILYIKDTHGLWYKLCKQLNVAVLSVLLETYNLWWDRNTILLETYNLWSDWYSILLTTYNLWSDRNIILFTTYNLCSDRYSIFVENV